MGLRWEVLLGARETKKALPSSGHTTQQALHRAWLSCNEQTLTSVLPRVSGHSDCLQNMFFFCPLPVLVLSVSKTQTHPEGCCAPVCSDGCGLPHPDLPGPLLRVRMHCKLRRQLFWHEIQGSCYRPYSFEEKRDKSNVFRSFFYFSLFKSRILDKLFEGLIYAWEPFFFFVFTWLGQLGVLQRLGKGLRGWLRKHSHMLSTDPFIKQINTPYSLLWYAKRVASWAPSLALECSWMPVYLCTFCANCFSLQAKDGM